MGNMMTKWKRIIDVRSDLNTNFGSIVRHAREQTRDSSGKVLTIAECAQQLKLSRVTLNRIELGTQLPNYYTLEAILEFFPSLDDSNSNVFVKRPTSNSLPKHYFTNEDRDSHDARCEIGRKIAEKRIEKGFTQHAVATRSGVSEATISRIEHGRVMSYKLFEIRPVDTSTCKICVRSNEYAISLGFKDTDEFNEWLEDENQFSTCDYTKKRL